MKRTVFRIALFIVLLSGAVLFFNYMRNRNSLRRTVGETQPTMEKIYASVSGRQVNELSGYQEELQTGLMRDTLTPVGKDQTARFLIPAGSSEKVSYRLRDFTGDNLIEYGDMTREDPSDGYDVYQVTFRMNLESGTEYSLQIDACGAHYYTRVSRMDDSRIRMFLKCAEDFHEAALSGNAAAVASAGNAGREGSRETDLGALQNNRISTATDALMQDIGGEETDSGLSRVTLSSREDDILYGGMNPEVTAAPVPEIRELSKDRAILLLPFLVRRDAGNGVVTFGVREYFTMKYEASLDAAVLTGYERDMSQNFRAEDVSQDLRGLNLGIQNPADVSYTASADGTRLAFLSGNSVWFYDSRTGYLASVYGNTEEEAARAVRETDGYRIRLLGISGGTLKFLVYGRADEGLREGENGLSLFNYSIEEGSLQELLFIPTDLSLQALELEAGKFCCYQNESSTLYLMLNQELLAINIRSGKKTVLVKGIPSGEVAVSEDASVAAFPDTKDLDKVTEIRLFNGKTGKITTISHQGKRLKILRFLNQNLLYGEADPEHVTVHADGNTDFLLSSLSIVNEDGQEVMKYQKDGILVSDVTAEEGRIVLDRVADQGDGSYQETGNDDITYIPEEETSAVTLTEESGEDGWEECRLIFPSSVVLPGRSSVILTKEESNPSEKICEVAGKTDTDSIYLYQASGIQAQMDTVGKAVQAAEAEGGFVTNGAGTKLYEDHDVKSFFTVAGTFSYESAESADQTMEACLVMALRSAGADLETGDISSDMGWEQAFQEYGNGAIGLNISGASLDTAISFLSDGAPFAAKLGDQYVMVVSYNETAIRYYDPVADQEERSSRSQFEENCQNAGNEFYVYTLAK